jgi:hypothetical protein
MAADPVSESRPVEVRGGSSQRGRSRRDRSGATPGDVHLGDRRELPQHPLTTAAQVRPSDATGIAALRAAANGGPAEDVARLQHEVERGPVSALGSAAQRAIALADISCWESLTRGDIAAFGRQAQASADLRLFSFGARLLAEE